MSQQIWLREDLKNLLLSLNVASAAAARFSDEEATMAYRRGYEEAIQTLAVALGISPAKVGFRVVNTPCDGEHPQLGSAR